MEAKNTSLSVPSLRARRPVVVEDKSWRSNAPVDAAMRRELQLRQSPPFPDSIVVVDHPNCPIGAWSVGDLITVSGRVATGASYSGLLRVVSWNRLSRWKAKLSLLPAVPL